MTKAAQMRVSAMLKEAWGADARITRQADGGLVAYLTGEHGQVTVLCVGEESSPLLAIVGRVLLGE
ncbi:MAG: hypothetical protein JWM19_2594 [Actinomycetia bacterium]|nr:hypothetical protein [Actinomycetes bacterium]